MNPQELKSTLSWGLLSFPVTDFNAQGDFHRAGYIKRLEWLAPYGASALFVAGGTDECFSLAASDFVCGTLQWAAGMNLHVFTTGRASIEDLGWELFHYYLDVASGRKQTWAQKHKLHNDITLFNPAPIT